VEMIRLVPGTPHGISGTSAPACTYWMPEQSGAAARGFVKDHASLKANDGTARPMGTPGGRSG